MKKGGKSVAQTLVIQMNQFCECS